MTKQDTANVEETKARAALIRAQIKKLEAETAYTLAQVAQLVSKR